MEDVESSLRELPLISPVPSDAGTPAAPSPVGEGEEIASLDAEQEFQTFWDTYPADARTSPDYARKAYAKALRLGATPERILAALRREAGRAGRREMLSPTAWLKGGSWRIDVPQDAQPQRVEGNLRVIDRRFDGWEIGDHMALAKWRRARDSGTWKTLEADHNALPIEARREALWHGISGNYPRVAKFIIEHEPDGLPAEVA